MLDIFSYFRRRRGSALRRPAAAGDDAINLASMGGVINGTYLDIASAPAAIDGSVITSCLRCGIPL